MTTVLFWNLKGKRHLTGSLCNLCQDLSVNVVAIAEPPSDRRELLDDLGRKLGDVSVPEPRVGVSRVEVAYRAETVAMTEKHRAKYWSLYELIPFDSSAMILAVAHLPSKISHGFQRAEDRLVLFQQLRSDIRDVERRLNNKCSIVIGDLNQNPFDDVLVNATGMNAVMSKEIALRMHCTIRNKTYDYFYNPMWSSIGDESVGPPGTHYYREPGHVRYYWHSLDQVLLSPAVVAAYTNTEASVISDISGKSLLNSDGRPDTRRFSDHLPIVLKVKASH